MNFITTLSKIRIDKASMTEFEEQVTAKLKSRFPEDQSDISKVVERVKEAQDYEYADHLDLEDVESVITGIENWSQNHLYS